MCTLRFLVSGFIIEEKIDFISQKVSRRFDYLASSFSSGVPVKQREQETENRRRTEILTKTLKVKLIPSSEFLAVTW